MNFNVKVSGIPLHAKLRHLITLFSKILSMRSNEFCLRNHEINGLVKQVLLSLPSHVEAQLAQEKLDSYVYEFRHNTYVFTAEMQDNFNWHPKKPIGKSKFNNKPKQMYNRQHREEYYPERSLSPHYEDASSKLDMQLEILRKQRMILEEERKLMEEQRKLNELRMRSFDIETPSVVQSPHQSTAYEDLESSELSTNLPKTKSKSKQPTFYQASEVLMKRMKMFIYKHSSEEERKALIMHVRSIIKQRMGTLVAEEGRGTYQTHKVVKLYRSKYPPLEDEDLVEQALKDVRGLQTADTKKYQMVLKGATAKNKPGEIESAADDQALQKGEVAAKDTAQSGNSISVDEKDKKKFVEKRLFFYKSSASLIRKMHYLMDEYSTPETRKILVEYLRFTLKQRLAAVVGGQPIYQTHKILNLYREQHPPETDDDLVKQLAKDIAEGRVPEEVMSKCNPIKVNMESDRNHDSTLDNKSQQEEIQNDGTDKSDHPEDNKDAGVFGKKENEGDVEINTDDKIQPEMENQNNEENKVKSTVGIGPDKEIEKTENDAPKSNDNDDNLVTDQNIKSDEIDNDINNDVTDNDMKCDATGNDNKNNVMDNDMKSVMTTEAIHNSPDNVIVKEESHGVKRKSDEDENTCIKVAKTDNAALISSEDSDKNDLEDKNDNQNFPDNVTVKEDSQGIKRKCDEDENTCIKVAKIDNVAVISSEDSGKHDLKDKN